jgi:hypothetical protein
MTTTLTQRADVLRAVDEFIAFLNARIAEHRAAHAWTANPATYKVGGGRKYIRIEEVAQPYGGRRVHCFVDAETGGVYKAASWFRPALNGERFNLLDPLSVAHLKHDWDPCGFYLYKR